MLQKNIRYLSPTVFQLINFKKFEMIKILLLLNLNKNIFISDFTARDYIGSTLRFQIILYLNYTFKICIRIKELQKLQSITSLFLSSNWLEREIFDLFGIFFYNHPQLQRLLTNYGFKGHPLRKDFPLTGFTEIHFFEVINQFTFEPVVLTQNYRNFYFNEVWKK